MTHPDERTEHTEHTPQPVERLGDCVHLGGLDGVVVEMRLAVLGGSGWELLGKASDEAEAVGTIFKGANGNTYFKVHIDNPAPFLREEPIQVEVGPYQLSGHWVQYLGYPLSRLPNGNPLPTKASPRPPRPGRRISPWI